MTKGRFDTAEPIKNPNIVALFGYLVRCNCQIHDFQNKVIKEYLERKGVSYSIVHDVIFFKEESVSFENALTGLRLETVKIKREILFYLVVVSEIDGITDFEEKNFFSNILNNVQIDRNEDVIEAAKKKAGVERKRFKKANSANHTGKRANPNSTDNLFRITQKEYISAISRCRKIAREDYSEVKPITENIISKGKYFYSNLNSMLRKNIDFHPEVIEALENFSKSIEVEVFEEVKAFQQEFAKKESTVEDFTIALIGRTKAGKSTLRAVLTGQGKENIGCGSQRTTRINDIYEWNHLRIIDTPGIDAGSDEENEDQKIAEKVIGEADIICYIAASDGLPQNAREFAVNLAKRNKPVIVLVNYKSNINGSSRFRRFIENPSAWQQTDSSNAIEGYFYPIKRLAEENGVDSLISCKAVFLYAALLSKDENYKDYSKILNEHSGMNEFLVLLKDAVVNKGSFLRSKTIIDDTIVECLNWVQRIEALMAPISSMYNSLSDERKSTLEKIKKAKIRLLSESERIIDKAFKKLATSDANVFAEENYMKKGNISKEWATYCEKIDFHGNLQKDIDKAFENFVSEISAVINDLFEDLQFTIPETKLDKSISKGKNLNVPFRELFRFAGSGLGIAGTIALIIAANNPVGWVLTGVGLVLSFVSSLFMSKSKRQQKEKKNLYSKINSAVNSQSKKFLAEAKKSLNDESEKCIHKIMKRYDNLLSGLSFTSDYCEALIRDMNASIDILNIYFAQRIVEYLVGNQVSVLNVRRDYGKCIEFYLGQNVDISDNDLTKIQGLLNEQIIIYNKER